MAGDRQAVISERERAFLAEDRIVLNTVEPMKLCLLALGRIYAGKLWQGHFDSWDAYCKERTGLSGSYVSRKIRADELNARILPMGKKLNEREARALGGFLSELQPEIYQRAVEVAGGHEQLTCGIIERVGREILEERQEDVEDEEPEQEQEIFVPPPAAQEAEIVDVLSEVQERTRKVQVHVLYRADDGYRLAAKKLHKTVSEDMQNKKLRKIAMILRERLQADVKFLNKLLQTE